MRLENDVQLANTERKLELLEEQIRRAQARPPSACNAESLVSLSQMANQLREEIIRYRAERSRKAS